MSTLLTRRLLTTVLVLASLSAVLPSRARGLDHDVVIAVYQGPCQDGDFSANLATTRRAIADARAQGCNFLALPECFLSGYDTVAHFQRGTRRLDDPELKAFIAETATHDLVVLVGMGRIEKEGVYNSVLVIQHGRLLGIYDKVMLLESERDEFHMLRGKTVPVFHAHGVAFAVNICHDTSFPQPALLARLQGAQILFTPHYNCIPVRDVDDHHKWSRNTHLGLATQMKMVVARSNVVVTDKKDRLGDGDSFILSPRGDVLAEAGAFRTRLISARITPAMLRPSYVWADLNEVPADFNNQLGDLLKNGGPSK